MVLGEGASAVTLDLILVGIFFDSERTVPVEVRLLADAKAHLAGTACARASALNRRLWCAPAP